MVDNNDNSGPAKINSPKGWDSDWRKKATYQLDGVGMGDPVFDDESLRAFGFVKVWNIARHEYRYKLNSNMNVLAFNDGEWRFQLEMYVETVFHEGTSFTTVSPGHARQNISVGNFSMMRLIIFTITGDREKSRPAAPPRRVDLWNKMLQDLKG